MVKFLLLWHRFLANFLWKNELMQLDSRKLHCEMSADPNPQNTFCGLFKILIYIYIVYVYKPIYKPKLLLRNGQREAIPKYSNLARGFSLSLIFCFIQFVESG